MRGRLVKDITVSLLDFSLSGCRVAVNHPIDPQTTGNLRISMGGKKYLDTVHVVRTTKHQGYNHTFTLGGTFAFGNRPGTASVRGEVPSTAPTLT
jgi:hypothetical protein